MMGYRQRFLSTSFRASSPLGEVKSKSVLNHTFSFDHAFPATVQEDVFNSDSLHMVKSRSSICSQDDVVDWCCFTLAPSHGHVVLSVDAACSREDESDCFFLTAQRATFANQNLEKAGQTGSSSKTTRPNINEVVRINGDDSAVEMTACLSRTWSCTVMLKADSTPRPVVFLAEHTVSNGKLGGIRVRGPLPSVAVPSYARLVSGKENGIFGRSQQ